MKSRRRERGWQTRRVYWKTTDDGIIAAAQAIISWDLGRPEHERRGGLGLSITDSIEIANLAVAGWLLHHPTLRTERSGANGADGAWCDYCTPRKLYHPTDHPAQRDGRGSAVTLTEELVAWLADLEDYHDRRADPDGWADPGEHDALMARKGDILERICRGADAG